MNMLWILGPGSKYTAISHSPSLQEQRRLFDVYSTKSTSTTSTDIKTREIDVE